MTLIEVELLIVIILRKEAHSNHCRTGPTRASSGRTEVEMPRPICLLHADLVPSKGPKQFPLAPNSNPCCRCKQRMKYFRFVDAIAKTSSWTCHKCLRDGRKQTTYLASFTTNAADSPPWKSCGQKASQPRRSLNRTITLRDLTLGRSFFSSLPSDGSTLKFVPLFKGRRRIRRGLILAILAVGSIWSFSDDAKHSYIAVKRALRVFYALVQCVREYVLPPSLDTFSNASHPADE